jgi:demethylsterigmatocystin 6-O-methyltransferase
MRNIMHDYPDLRCLQILRNIVPALNSDSEIWIDEVVVPDIGATEAQVNWDWTMVAAVAGMERSRSQWEQLLGAAGLAIRKIWTVDEGRGESVIVAVPKQ